jgi:hypothetical protein
MCACTHTHTHTHTHRGQTYIQAQVHTSMYLWPMSALSRAASKLVTGGFARGRARRHPASPGQRRSPNLSREAEGDCVCVAGRGPLLHTILDFPHCLHPAGIQLPGDPGVPLHAWCPLQIRVTGAWPWEGGTGELSWAEASVSFQAQVFHPLSVFAQECSYKQRIKFLPLRTDP